MSRFIFLCYFLHWELCSCI